MFTSLHSHSVSLNVLVKDNLISCAVGFAPLLCQLKKKTSGHTKYFEDPDALVSWCPGIITLW